MDTWAMRRSSSRFASRSWRSRSRCGSPAACTVARALAVRARPAARLRSAGTDRAPRRGTARPRRLRAGGVRRSRRAGAGRPARVSRRPGAAARRRRSGRGSRCCRISLAAPHVARRCPRRSRRFASPARLRAARACASPLSLLVRSLGIQFRRRFTCASHSRSLVAAAALAVAGCGGGKSSTRHDDHDDHGRPDHDQDRRQGRQARRRHHAHRASKQGAHVRARRPLGRRRRDPPARLRQARRRGGRRNGRLPSSRTSPASSKPSSRAASCRSSS